MPLEEWQRHLRKQFASEQPFRLENIGEHPIFSDYRVTNPARGSVYRVAIRSAEPGRNYCSCADFRTNHLGTCKHIEFTGVRAAIQQHQRRVRLAAPCAVSRQRAIVRRRCGAWWRVTSTRPAG
jgi:hypothetical protein